MSAEPTIQERRQPTAQEFRDMQASEEFGQLRSKFRSFAFPMTVAFFVWYIAYVLIATFATEWMATPLFGSINIGLIFGLLQFVTTFLITWIYVVFSNKYLEPGQVAIRKKMEG